MLINKAFRIASTIQTMAIPAAILTGSAWKRLMNDIEAGRASTVLAKDMSRIGRDYLQTGFYTEEFFRQYGIRLVAIANNADSSD